MTHVAYVAFGANLGDRRANIRWAGELLRRSPGVLRLDLSRLYETEPVGGPCGQEPYLNAAARLETVLDAQTLLRALLDIERRLGRERAEKWGPRTIDLDLLLFDEQVIATPELTVPHPRMHERRFVLSPLVEIAPGAVHPVLKRSVREILAGLQGPLSSTAGSALLPDAGRECAERGKGEPTDHGQVVQPEIE